MGVQTLGVKVVPPAGTTCWLADGGTFAEASGEGMGVIGEILVDEMSGS